MEYLIYFYSTTLYHSQAEGALNELDFLAQRLQDSRDSITKTDTEHTLVKRELELVRHALQESLAMSEIEHANIHTARSRLVELKHELSETEQRILICKESCLKEEDKLRSTKATATDQLRLLQMELSKFQSDFKVSFFDVHLLLYFVSKNVACCVKLHF